MGVEHPAQFVDLGRTHALGGQPTGHALERFADLVQFDQFSVAQRYHASANMRHPHQQALAFEAMDSLTQWAPADAVGARQLRLGDLAAWGDFAFDDGSLDTPEDVFRKRLAFFHYVGGAWLDPAYCRHLELQ